MKKLSAIFTVILISVALGGCAATSYIPPSSYDKESSREYDHSYQVSWDAVLDLITAAGYKLDQVSKDSGYISIARRLRVDSSEADCGKFKAGDTLQIYTKNATANVAIRFKKLSGDRSEVSVVVTAEYIVTGMDHWDGSFYERVFSCESTGELERKVLDYVSNYKG